MILAGAITAVSCAAVGLALYAHLSSSLHLFWSQQHRFLEVTPVHTFVPRLATMASTAVAQDPDRTRLLETWVGIVLMVVALVGLTAGAKVWSSGLALAAALAAAALGLIPWGTGRTDMVLYPALALLVAFGVERIVAAAAERVPAVPVERDRGRR